MPQLRKDPITSRWVIISTERGKRPSDFSAAPAPRQLGFCPFCPGNEDKTPPEIMAYRKDGNLPNRKGWSLRVVPNKFPALQIEGDLDREGEGIYDKMHGLGAHEVIIESPNHNDTLSAMPEERVEDVLWAYRDRMLDLKKDDRFRYILIFKNHGEQAGASLEHPILSSLLPLSFRSGLEKRWTAPRPTSITRIGASTATLSARNCSKISG